MENAINMLLSYCPESYGSSLVWKHKRTGVRKTLKAGNKNKKGYWDVRVNGKLIKAHRIIWFLHNGTWPIGDIDHIDGDKNNNQIENLRDVTRSENNRNRNIITEYKSKLKNVSFHKKTSKWRVRIGLGWKEIHCGVYDDLELAELVAYEAREKYHGIYARHA
jgi:hypothetical protein